MSTNETSLSKMFAVKSIDRESDSESDYETAVELMHWNTCEIIIKISTPYGLDICLSRREVHTSTTYLEPDFDLFEETGRLKYVSHPGQEIPGKVTYSAYCLMPILKARFNPDFPHELTVMDDFEESRIKMDVSKDWIDQVIEASEADVVAIYIPTSQKTLLDIKNLESKLENIRLKNIFTNIHNSCELAKVDILGIGYLTQQESVM
jgi:hypothetical protein